MTKQAQIVNLKRFVIVALDIGSEIFVMHIAIWEKKEMAMDSIKNAYIKAQVGVLIFDKAPTIILIEYFDYSNVFLAKNVAELL